MGSDWNIPTKSKPLRSLDKEHACVAAGYCPPRKARRKSTRRWCKGKPGVPHVYASVRQASLPNGSRRSLQDDLDRRGYTLLAQVCLTCGKQPGGGQYLCLNCGHDQWATHTRWIAYTVRLPKPLTRTHYLAHEKSCKACGQWQGKPVGTRHPSSI